MATADRCARRCGRGTPPIRAAYPDRLCKRFAVRRVCVVADRGMISAETIAELEARGLLYTRPIATISFAIQSGCEPGDVPRASPVHAHRQMAFLNFAASSDPPVASPAL